MDLFFSIQVRILQRNQGDVSLQDVFPYPLVNANFCCLFFCFPPGRPEEAEKCYLKSLSIKPNSADGNINLAHLLRVTERFREADGQYQKALTLRPNHPQLNYFHGVVLEKLGNRKVSCPFSVKIISLSETTENLRRKAEEKANRLARICVQFTVS